MAKEIDWNRITEIHYSNRQGKTALEVLTGHADNPLADFRVWQDVTDSISGIVFEKGPIGGVASWFREESLDTTVISADMDHYFKCNIEKGGRYSHKPYLSCSVVPKREYREGLIELDED